MNPDFATIDALKEQWDALQPLTAENDARLWKKMRLEWNYNSNHIEGNTLTYGETELLLIHDRTTGDHQLRDYEEMKAHDVGIAHIRELAGKDPIIGEADIRNLNKIILKEPFWKEAITADGKPTRKQVIPGQYKSAPNNVRTATGEIFMFASPSETPAKMADLVSWLRKSLEEPRRHAMEIISKLHHDFALIHPFDDGNGRVARLLVNYVLLRGGFPPLIVKAADKASYLTALRKADAGDLAALTTYLAAQAEWSLDVGIKAAKGESVEEPSDVEKELAIFIRDQQQDQDRVKRRSPEVLLGLYELSWRGLFTKFEDKIRKLTPLFADVSLIAKPHRHDQHDWSSAFASVATQGSVTKFQITAQLQGYRGRSASPFNLEAELRLSLQDFEYRVIAIGREVAKKLYSEPILSDEADQIASDVLKHLFNEIKTRTANA